jgi:histidine triad (HIT) family protein
MRASGGVKEPGRSRFAGPGRAAARPCRGQIMNKTLFEKIIAREIPATIVYEDDLVFAVRDINPQAPKHYLLVPKKPIPRLSEAKPEDHKVLGHLLLKAAEVAANLGLTEKGFRIVINNGEDAGEAVPHLHIHILGGRHMSWPPG